MSWVIGGFVLAAVWGAVTWAREQGRRFGWLETFTVGWKGGEKVGSVLGLAGRWVDRLPPRLVSGWLDGNRAALARAGEARVTAGELAAGQLAAALAGVALGSWVAGSWNVVVVLIGGGSGAACPRLWLRSRAERRAREVTRELPQVLELVTLAVEAGMEYGAAVGRVLAVLGGGGDADRGGGSVLQRELSETQRVIGLGRSRAAAYRELATRVGHPGLSKVVAGLLQAMEVGAALGPVLRTQAAAMRQERIQLAERLAAEAPIKILFPLLVFIFPTIFLILFAPLVIQVMSGRL